MHTAIHAFGDERAALEKSWSVTLNIYLINEEEGKLGRKKS